MEIAVCRNSFQESLHQIEAHIVKTDGSVVFSTGKDFSFFSRSAVKPLQAQLLIESGAFESFNLTSEHLALAGASHSGEEQHTSRVGQWLRALQLNETHLECGAQWPDDSKDIYRLGQKGEKVSALHNNCSGKHAGLLSVCVHNKWDVRNYHQVDHPVQQHLKKLLEERLEEKLEKFGIDGCSIPAFLMSFQGLAKAYARVANQVLEKRISPASMVFNAFQQHPALTAGVEDYCYHVMAKNPGQLLVKIGAEGVMIAFSPAKKMSAVIKVRDGAYRAAEVALDEILEKFFGLNPVGIKTLRNRSGREVGSYQVRI